jgi:hypothetical protein
MSLPQARRPFRAVRTFGSSSGATACRAAELQSSRRLIADHYRQLAPDVWQIRRINSLAVINRKVTFQVGDFDRDPESNLACHDLSGGRSPVALRLLHSCQRILDSEPHFVFGFGSGTGIRTLNLAVNRSLQPVQK